MLIQRGKVYEVNPVMAIFFHWVSTCKMNLTKVRSKPGHSIKLKPFMLLLNTMQLNSAGQLNCFLLTWAHFFSRCVRSTENVCVLTAVAARAWRRPSPPPVRPPHHGLLAATPQAHRWAYLPAHPDATAQQTLRWGRSTPRGLWVISDPFRPQIRVKKKHSYIGFLLEL